MKKIASKALTVCLMAAIFASTFAIPAVFADENKTATAANGTITVDGIKEDLWDQATAYSVESIITGDTTNAAAAPESSKVTFRTMWDDSKIYMLFEIEDDVFKTGVSDTNWKNDSIFIYVSEDGSSTGLNNELSYQMCAFLDNGGLIVRDGKGTNTGEKQHAVKIEGNKAIVEIAFTLNTVTPQANQTIKIDIQYNDQDVDPSADGNSRTVTWSWSSAEPNQQRDTWGTLTLAANESNTETKDPEETKEEAPKTGDFYLLWILVATIASSIAIVKIGLYSRKPEEN